jgi:hypothetical protein
MTTTSDAALTSVGHGLRGVSGGLAHEHHQHGHCDLKDSVASQRLSQPHQRLAADDRTLVAVTRVVGQVLTPAPPPPPPPRRAHRHSGTGHQHDDTGMRAPHCRTTPAQHHRTHMGLYSSATHAGSSSHCAMRCSDSSTAVLTTTGDLRARPAQTTAHETPSRHKPTCTIA